MDTIASMSEPLSPTPDQPEVGDEIQLISDGDGLAVIGHEAAVERFLVSEGLKSRDLGLPRLRDILAGGAGVAQGAAAIASASGRWVQLTDESVSAINKWGLMKSNQTGLSMGVVYSKGDPQGIKKIVQFVSDPGTVGSRALNPLVLSNAAALMAQVAMQQAMDEITDYLATIDEKVDDILRAQKDAVVADMIGVDFVIEEAMTIRGHVGRVSEITWSKVQATAMTLARTQAYALRQLDALAEKLERKTEVMDVAQITTEAESKVREWLAVLARCFQLQDAIAVLELDRVLGAFPDELNQHRIGLRTARENRLQLISRTTGQLLTRMNAAVEMANTWVLLHPLASPAVVRSSNQVSGSVHDFRTRLGIEAGSQSWMERQWVDAAVETWDVALVTGARGVDAAARLGGETLDRATEVFRSVDLDGDGVPDKPRALTAVADAGSAIQGAAAGAVDVIGAAAGSAGATIQGVAAGAVGALGSLFGWKKGWGDPLEKVEPDSPREGS